MRVRWCCAEFKENAGAGKVTLIGIRHQESTRRAKRKEVEVSNHEFSGTLEELDKYRETRNNKKKKRTKHNVNEPLSIVTAKGERTLGCIRGKESLLISPIIDWTEEDVWEFLNKVMQVPHCSLYDEGWKRIGCIGCPMSSPKQKRLEMIRYPHVKRNWIKAIMRIRMGGGINKHQYLQEQNYPPPIHLNSYQKEIRTRLYMVEHQRRLDTTQTPRTTTTVTYDTQPHNIGRTNRGIWAGFQIALLLTA